MSDEKFSVLTYIYINTVLNQWAFRIYDSCNVTEANIILHDQANITNNSYTKTL